MFLEFLDNIFASFHLILFLFLKQYFKGSFTYKVEKYFEKWIFVFFNRFALLTLFLQFSTSPNSMKFHSYIIATNAIYIPYYIFVFIINEIFIIFMEFKFQFFI